MYKSWLIFSLYDLCSLFFYPFSYDFFVFIYKAHDAVVIFYIMIPIRKKLEMQLQRTSLFLYTCINY